MYTSKTKLETGAIRHVPQVNINGTGKKSLLEEVEAAVHALRDARKACAALTVHGRDFQMMGDPHGETAAAREEQEFRLSALDELIAEYMAYWLAIEEQGR